MIILRVADGQGVDYSLHQTPGDAAAKLEEFLDGDTPEQAREHGISWEFAEVELTLSSTSVDVADDPYGF